MRCKGGSNTPRVWTSYVRGLCREILSPSLIRHMGGLAKEMLALKMGDLVGFSSGSASLGNVSFSLADS